jgi:hypothetical protein
LAEQTLFYSGPQRPAIALKHVAAGDRIGARLIDEASPMASSKVKKVAP